MKRHFTTVTTKIREISEGNLKDVRLLDVPDEYLYSVEMFFVAWPFFLILLAIWNAGLRGSGSYHGDETMCNGRPPAAS